KARVVLVCHAQWKCCARQRRGEEGERRCQPESPAGIGSLLQAQGFQAFVGNGTHGQTVVGLVVSQGGDGALAQLAVDVAQTIAAGAQGSLQATNEGRCQLG